MAEEYRNYMNNTSTFNEDEVVEFVKTRHLEGGRWYIKMGFAGFNCPANNGFGFETKSRALRAVRRYQGK